ncbi:MAG: preprotein translocase subunit Tim44 [Oceanospirillaceae bacterium]|uniref:Tim44 domain-containing protein n=1 Tax=unclassified Thalassolituus TaxID=2624967 RepID=UPI000C4BFFF5|nr:MULTISPECIES: Tim44-like domain-containing protein [unclassified Thalassolituus]MAS25884.1 preprotein translocase subunit Tim44 [Oceanospirillaceae bacterium]MAX98702.1 preprotein translocase subunit Tim44 [Oceanospirillaceae bacterium]MBS52375.1 preprotein translocase subunit Tim44 [Oceanospirillaceae bacterium]
MKTLITIITSIMLLAGMVHTAEAKKFGSGGFGKSFSTTPYKKSSPQDASGSKQTTSPTASNGRRGLMGGMLGGLLAGGLFAYLLGSGAFEGIQFMDILLLAALAFIIFKLLRRKAPGHAQQRQAWAGGDPGHDSSQQDFTSASGGSADQSVPMNFPPGFDGEAFAQGAEQHFREVQEAWNKGDLSVIAEYVAPELYAALARQRQSMMVPPQTEVLDLSAEIVRGDYDDQHAQISILFRGRVKDELEKSEDGIFDIWHLERDLSKEDAPWLIVGIEAE